MRFTYFKLILGLALAGCTINNTRISVDYSAPVATPVIAVPVTVVTPAVTKERAEHTPDTIPDVVKQAVACKMYVPLPVPEPVKISLEKLKAAKNSSELNELLLENVKQLHKQLTDYGKRSSKHYKEYVNKCSSKQGN